MNKFEIRNRVWRELDKVAIPDTRFHRNYLEFIPDFENSEKAIDRLISHENYKEAGALFITPDNCLEDLRLQSLRDGKKLIVTTEAG